MRSTLLIGLLCASPAYAQDPIAPEDRPGIAIGSDIDLIIDGHTRWIATSHPDFAVDAQGDGTMVGQGLSVDHRLRVGARLVHKRWKLHVQGDLFNGQIAGDTWDIEGAWDERRRDAKTALTVDGFTPRQAYLEGMIGDVRLTAGLVTPHWGTGMLANNGEQQPLFGRTDLGDRNLRLSAFTAPFKGKGGPKGHLPLYVGVAADAVVSDDTSRWADGQSGFNAVGAVLWDPEDGKLKAGSYVVYRYQIEADNKRTTNAIVPDVYADLLVDVGDWKVRVAGEGAVTLGKTSRALSYNARDNLALAAGGAVLIGELHAPQDRLIVHLRSGIASGDRNPDDGRANNFSFDRNYDVGSVLFDEYMGAIEAGTSAVLRDPQYAGQAPDGIEGLTTEGAFRRAVYVQPAVEAWATKWLNVRAGVVMAMSTAPHNQPFYTLRAGGDWRTHLDSEPGGRGIGTELNWAIRVDPNQTARKVARGSERERTADMRVVHNKRPVQPWLLLQGAHGIVSKDLATDGERGLMLLSGQVQVDW